MAMVAALASELINKSPNGKNAHRQMVRILFIGVPAGNSNAGAEIEARKVRVTPLLEDLRPFKYPQPWVNEGVYWSSMGVT